MLGIICSIELRMLTSLSDLQAKRFGSAGLEHRSQAPHLRHEDRCLLVEALPLNLIGRTQATRRETHHVPIQRYPPGVSHLRRQRQVGQILPVGPGVLWPALPSDSKLAK